MSANAKSMDLAAAGFFHHGGILVVRPESAEKRGVASAEVAVHLFDLVVFGGSSLTKRNIGIKAWVEPKVP